MPKFPVNFRRKSAAADDEHGPLAQAQSSFRVLERSDASDGIKSFDGGARMSKAMTFSQPPKTVASELVAEDNIFAGFKNNRGSGGSNTTKTGSDNSSRHSNASTAPSSTDYPPPTQEPATRKPVTLQDNPPRNSGGFLRNAGRTFSFGSKKNSLPPIPAEDPVPTVPENYASEFSTPGGRSRAPTASTVTTATPPRVDDSDFMLDLGGDLSNMLSKFDKRSSVATLKERSLTANRPNQPAALNLDQRAPIDPPQHSWNSDNSNDRLMGAERIASPPTVYEAPPPVPQHNFNAPSRHNTAEADEDAMLLRESLAASSFLNTPPEPSSSRSGGNGRQNASPRYGLRESYAPTTSRFDPHDDEENMFSSQLGRPTRVVAPRLGSRSKTEPNNKIMTPEEFEKYRRDKVKAEMMGETEPDESDKDDEDNYDDDEDELERSRQLAKQRRKQEAHMTVYRQQMMKVTGEASNPPPRPVPASMSTPNLGSQFDTVKLGTDDAHSDGSDDEEIPLAILQAHGFPNKQRPPTRLGNSPSNSNLRASAVPNHDGNQSVEGQKSGSGGSLPPFARKLPQDPYLGAGLIHQNPRESFALGGGAPGPRPVPSGGLVGVIANEERSKAMRRGSPAVDPNRNPSFALPGMNGGLDNSMPPPQQQQIFPGGMPHMPHMPQMPQMQPPPMSVGDQAQLQMTQQMGQFMQMQMQFMQMMAGQGQQMPHPQQPRPHGHMATPSTGSLGDMQRMSYQTMDPGMNGMNGMNGRESFIGLEPPRPQSQMRTMSMVQPSSASWIQPPQPNFGGAPSIRIQGDGYTPSIAPSERSNIGLPGRYRPVSNVPADHDGRTSTMSGALSGMHISRPSSASRHSPLANSNNDDDDDEEGWEAMKAKRDKKKGLWRTKKSLGSEIGALIT